MSVDPRQIADLLDNEGDIINEMGSQPGILPDPNTPPRMDPAQFISAMNSVIASAPHGQQDAVLKKLAMMAKADPSQLVAMLSQLEPMPGTNYLQDFFRSRGSNIMTIANIAGALFDENTVIEILDNMSPAVDVEDEEDAEEELEYNSEGDGYSH